MRTFKYVLIYLLIIQFALFYLVPLDMVYGHRMEYDLIKDNTNNIDTILEQIGKEIKQKDLKDYLIILGDSVAFSGPGDSKQSIGFYLEEIYQEVDGDKDRKVFNLALPAMQVGDIYTMLLKLDKHGISTDNLIFNVTYAGFVARNPDPPIVFWLKNDLKLLDPQSYGVVSGNLAANDYSKSKTNYVSYLSWFLEEQVYPKLSLYKYKDFIKGSIINYKASDALGDARLWSEKEGLRELLEQPEYQRDFSPQPFDMTSANLQLFFLDKILEKQEGKNTLIFLAATNEVLMAEEVNKSGYRDNLQKIDSYFRDKDIKFLNMQGKITESNFSDHVHLTSEGYQELAKTLHKHLSLP